MIIKKMKQRQLTPEEIATNFDKFRSLCEKLGDRSQAALNLVDSLGERLAICPASSRLDFHNCMVGGLVDHSLRVLYNAMKLCKTFGWEVSKDSLIIGCLFHDIGKAGNHEQDYYLPQDSDWHREKLGEMYKYNRDMQYMTVPDRGVWLCQHFGLKLSQDEWLAIKLNDGQYADENAPYKMKEPKLVDIVHTADLISTKQEKE
jgi:putative nucleotidyltransferase with HDIG domain